MIMNYQVTLPMNQVFDVNPGKNLSLRHTMHEAKKVKGHVRNNSEDKL